MPITKAIAHFASRRTLLFVFLLALAAGGYAALPTLTEWPKFNKEADSFHIPIVITVVLSCLLVFRTSSAYNRWWEARTLWGALVNASRNLALKICNLGDIDPENRELARQAIVAFPVALRCHLRDESETVLSDEIRKLAHNFDHVPQGLVQQVYGVLARAKAAGKIDGDELRAIDLELLRYLDICGGCERIKGTRVVRSYRVFARQCVVIYLLTLPWVLEKEFGWYTLPLTSIMAYFMVGMEIVAEHVEEPFGYDEDDLDLERLCEVIKRTVDEVFAHRTAAGGAKVET